MGKPRRKSPKPSSETCQSATTGQDAARFVDGLMIRGEAAEKEHGKLPSGATHEIVKKSDQGEITVKRRRFSAY